MHYFLIAGEASGDLHGAALIEALRKADPAARFTFLGGDKMAEAAGSAPLIHYSRMAFMGFSEVLRNLRSIFGNLATARKALADERPDALILIDYPSFNLKVARTAAKLGIPAYYYISPKIWAWKQWRVKDIRRLMRKVLCILPFEVDFYRGHGMEVDYVGNPSVEEIDALIAAAPDRAEFLAEHRLRDRPIVALLPGSRKGEIRCNLPVMAQAMRRFPQYRAVIAGAPGIDDSIYRHYTALPVVRDATPALLKNARAAIVTSGTATLETALAGVPQVAVYRSNGSKLAYKIMERLLHVKYVTLPNLIADEPVIPELLVHLCTPDSVAEHLTPLLRDTPERQAQLDGYHRMRSRLGNGHAATNAARIIVTDLNTITKQ